MASSSIFGKPPTETRINYVPHAGQDEVIDGIWDNFESAAPASIIEIIASRGWGKTVFMVCAVLAPYLDQNPNARVMWVAPTYSIAITPIDDVFKGINDQFGETYVPEFDEEGARVWEFVTTKSGPVLKWWNGATVHFKSADAPDSIVSKGFNLIIIDEAALIEEKVFNQQILGTARRAGIKIFLISTPRGKKHWTYRFFLKGQDKTDTNYLSFQQPYTKNPFFNTTLVTLIKDIPEWLYRQEYLAEFVDDGDAVIRGLDHILLDMPEINFPTSQQEWSLPIGDVIVKDVRGDVTRKASDRRFVVGMDLAKSVDYTVIWVQDLELGHFVHYHRFNKTDYREVVRIAETVCKAYNGAELIFDATGVGSAIADVLNDYDVIAHPFVFTNESKVDIVNKLLLAIEYQEIKIPNITTVKNELSVFTYTLTRTGKISYGAPAGFNDDIVMSMALANFYRKENAGLDEAVPLDDYIQFNMGKRPPRSFVDQMEEDND